MEKDSRKTRGINVKSVCVAITDYKKNVLVRIDENGVFYRINGLGKWDAITSVDLFNLITHRDEEEIEWIDSRCL